MLDEAKRLGLGLDAVTADLVVAGVKSFADAFDDLLGAVGKKRAELIEAKEPAGAEKRS